MQSHHSFFGADSQHPDGPRTERESIAFFGSFPPRPSPQANFTQDVASSYAKSFPHQECLGLALTDESREYEYPAEVSLEIRQSHAEDYQQAARFLNELKPAAVSLHHDYALYGGTEGEMVVDFLKRCEIPVVTTFHQVVPSPTAERWRVTEEILRHSASVVVTTEKARQLLLEHYPAREEDVHVIRPGVPDGAFPSTGPGKRTLGWEGRTVVLTACQLSPEEGLEHGIRAVAEVARRHPEVLYVIVGETHPDLLQVDEDRYLETLKDLVSTLHLEEHVQFVPRHLSSGDLMAYLGATDIYLAPSRGESHEACSFLACAMGCGCPVIATPRWHAKELLPQDAAIFTPFQDVSRLAKHLQALTADPARRARMREAALRAAQPLRWSKVVRQYERLFSLVAAQKTAEGTSLRVASPEEGTSPSQDALLQVFDHLLLMTDATGIWHRAKKQIPDPRHGYWMDDNAAALVLTAQLRASGKDAQLPWNEFSNPFFAFLLRAFNPEIGKFRSHMSSGEAWLEAEGSEESQARALWALGEVLGINSFTYLRQPIQALFQIAYPAAENFSRPRSWAYAILGIGSYLETEPGDTAARALLCRLKDNLAQQFTQNGDGQWPWPEDTLTTVNAVLPHALLIASHACDDELALGLALNSLEWLMELQTASSGVFRPIGNRGWYRRHSLDAPSPYDQVPQEAHTSLSACLTAWRLTGQDSWFHLAENTFQWFLGANDLGVSLYDPATGGCCDALQENSLNENQSAQGLLAYHLSLAELETARREFFASQGHLPPVPRSLLLYTSERESREGKKGARSLAKG